MPTRASLHRKLLLGLAASACLLVGACAGTASLSLSRFDQAVPQAPNSAAAMPSSAAPTLAPTLAPTPSPIVTPTPSPTPSPSPKLVVPQAQVPAKPASSVGDNSLAIPALGIDAPIGTSSCGGLIPDGIWRWLCAGANNMYLLGHAWGVFAPIHDGYHAGALTAGLLARYTDGAGTLHVYQLQWVEDLSVAVWGQGAAWAATPGPVITLQTCDGAASDYRIVVRFVPV